MSWKTIIPSSTQKTLIKSCRRHKLKIQNLISQCWHAIPFNSNQKNHHQLKLIQHLNKVSSTNLSILQLQNSRIHDYNSTHLHHNLPKANYDHRNSSGHSIFHPWSSLKRNSIWKVWEIDFLCNYYNIGIIISAKTKNFLLLS